MPKIVKFKPNQNIIPTPTLNIPTTVSDPNLLHVYSAPGLGDSLWALNLIYNNTEKDIHLHTFSRHVNSAYLLKNLPKIKQVSTFNKIRNYNEFIKICSQKRNEYNNLNNLNNLQEMYIELNTHVDSGNRIETYLPKLQPNFDLPYQETELERVLNNYSKKEYIILYTSSMSNNRIGPRHTGTWNFNNWKNIIDLFKNKYQIIWIGNSKYDIDSYNELKKYYNELILEQDNELSFLVPLFKNSKAFIGYQSGLNCITMQLQSNTYMLYFNCLQKLPYAITHPNIKPTDKLYKPVFFNNFNLEQLNQWVESI